MTDETDGGVARWADPDQPPGNWAATPSMAEVAYWDLHALKSGPLVCVKA